MATRPLSGVLQHLRHILSQQEARGLTDGQLLERFLTHQDEAAFEALVRRHGPMVLAVCRRVLHNLHDAEDAFQATFLVLIRKAASIRPREMVGNWLYGVAYRTALEARRARAKRRVKERQGSPTPKGEAVDTLGPELRAVLDQELERLPPKYRTVLVLCDLEGKTRKEVAHQLGWPEGTVASRLARARQLLAKRLTRYGLVLSGASVAATLSGGAASACVPPSLLAATVQAALVFAAGQAVTAGLISGEVMALAEGVLKTMLLSKLKLVTVLASAAVIVTGGVSMCEHYRLW